MSAPADDDLISPEDIDQLMCWGYGRFMTSHAAGKLNRINTPDRKVLFRRADVEKVLGQKLPKRSDRQTCHGYPGQV